MRTSKRAEKLTSSPLYVFAKKVKEQEVLGRKIISLGLGEPYYDTPEIIKEAGISAIKNNKTHYNPAQGSMMLRKKIAEIHGVDFECVSVSSGAKPFLGSVLWSLVDDGDIVFMAGPYYPPFFQIAQSCGAEVVLVDTKPNDFQLSAKILQEIFIENKTKEKKSCIIINSPNNPTGVTYQKEELEKIVKVCRENNVTIISDECYSNFSPDPAFSLRQFGDEIIVINSLSKSHAMTGWRLGYVVCPQELNVIIGRFLENYIGCPSSISDASAITALESGQTLPDLLEQRKIVHAWLDEMEIPHAKSTGGIFVFPDFSQIMKKFEISSSLDLATFFLEKAGVALTPGVAFGEKYDTHLRISYCLRPAELKSALEKLKAIL
ncbi:MAG: aspartate aminotransferase [uncultured bacterium]|nr:MAG: aspartate aminotransferase [uncultured bacterium]